MITYSIAYSVGFLDIKKNNIHGVGFCSTRAELVTGLNHLSGPVFLIGFSPSQPVSHNRYVKGHGMCISAGSVYNR